MFLLYRKEIIFWHLAHKVTCAINRGELVKPCLPRKHVGRLVTNYNYVSLPVAALQYFALLPVVPFPQHIYSTSIRAYYTMSY